MFQFPHFSEIWLIKRHIYYQTRISLNGWDRWHGNSTRSWLFMYKNNLYHTFGAFQTYAKQILRGTSFNIIISDMTVHQSRLHSGCVAAFWRVYSSHAPILTLGFLECPCCFECCFSPGFYGCKKVLVVVKHITNVIHAHDIYNCKKMFNIVSIRH